MKRCIGNDPSCPCQDGDACHYRAVAGTPAMRKPKLLSEFHIAKTCSDWLALDNWRRLNTNPVSDTATIQAIRGAIAKRCGSGGIPPWLQDCLRGRGKGFGELGMADDLYIRYTFLRDVGGSTTEARSLAQMLWIEWKRPGQTAKPHQKAWHAAERARGALVWVAEDTWVTPKDGDPIAAFQAHYRESGLMRKKL